MLRFLKIILFTLLFMLPNLLLAKAKDMGLGHVAENLLVPVNFMADFLTNVSLIIGITCLFAAFVRYMQHRVNPLAHPLGIVMLLLVLGIALLCLPLVYTLTESGVAPHSLSGN